MSNNHIPFNNDPISNTFVDKISSRETSLILPSEFSGLERICLTANGNLQRILRLLFKLELKFSFSNDSLISIFFLYIYHNSAWFNKPVKVEIIKNIPIDNINCNTVNGKLNNVEHDKCEDNSTILKRYEREVAIVCESKILCNAYSDVIVHDDKILHLIKNEGVGLGQLFR